MTLNEIAYSIADPLGKTKDVDFLARIKSRIKDKRAMLIRRDTEKNNSSKAFEQYITIPMEIADYGFSNNIITGKKFLKSVNKVPSAVRLNDIEDFLWVGDVHFTLPYSFIEIEHWALTKYNKFTSNTIKYGRLNDYLILMNNCKLKKVGLKFNFENPEEAAEYIGDGTCYNDDMEFPVSRDISDIIIVELIKENGATLQTEVPEQVVIEGKI